MPDDRLTRSKLSRTRSASGGPPCDDPPHSARCSPDSSAATLVAGPLTAPATAAPPRARPDHLDPAPARRAHRHARRHGRDTSALADDATYRAAVGAQFDTVTPENVMKWEVVEPEQGHFDFTQADTLVAFARAHGQKVRGHTLVWHNQLPAWLTSRRLDRGRAAAGAAAAHHDRGRPLPRPDLGRGTWSTRPSTRTAPCATRSGCRCSARATSPTRSAGRTRPTRRRSCSTTTSTSRASTPRATPSSRCSPAAAEGVPVQAVGAQGHLDTQFPIPRGSCRTCAGSPTPGMASAITEADVRSVLPVDATESAAQSAGYSAMLQGCLLVRRCLSFTVWGFTDKYQWVPGRVPGRGLGRAVGRELPAQARVRPGASRPRARAVRAAARLTARPGSGRPPPPGPVPDIREDS